MKPPQPMSLDETIEVILRIYAMSDLELRVHGVDVIEIPEKPSTGGPADCMRRVERWPTRILHIHQNIVAAGRAMGHARRMGYTIQIEFTELAEGLMAYACALAHGYPPHLTTESPCKMLITVRMAAVGPNN